MQYSHLMNESIESLRSSIDAIKAALAFRQVVLRGRQSGKTTALLEFVHEHDPGNMIIVVCNGITYDLTRQRYKYMFPQDPQHIIRSIHMVSNADVCGTNRKWVTDEVWPQAVVRKARSYGWAGYWGRRRNSGVYGLVQRTLAGRGR